MGSREVLLSSRQPGYVLSHVPNQQSVTGSRGGEDAWGPGGDSEGGKTWLVWDGCWRPPCSTWVPLPSSRHPTASRLSAAR